MSVELNQEKVNNIENKYDKLLKDLGIDIHEFYVLLNKIKYYNKQLQIYIKKEHPSTDKLNQVIEKSIIDLECWIELILLQSNLEQHLQEKIKLYEKTESIPIKYMINLQIEAIKNLLK